MCLPFLNCNSRSFHLRVWLRLWGMYLTLTATTESYWRWWWRCCISTESLLEPLPTMCTWHLSKDMTQNTGHSRRHKTCGFCMNMYVCSYVCTCMHALCACTVHTCVRYACVLYVQLYMLSFCVTATRDGNFVSEHTYTTVHLHSSTYTYVHVHVVSCSY